MTVQQFTLITPRFVARVQGRDYGHVHSCAEAVGLTVLGIHRDGDEGFYDPTFTPRPAHSRRRRDTAFSRAFEGLGQ